MQIEQIMDVINQALGDQPRLIDPLLHRLRSYMA